MKNLTEEDLRAWLSTVTHPLATSSTLKDWLEGPLKQFFPYRGVVLGHGELVAGQLNVTHMLSCGHADDYLQQIATTFELFQRGSLKWWFTNRRPFYIDPRNPPPHASAFEIDEIERFGLLNVAGHGILNAKSNAGTYFGFSGVRTPLSAWHLDALRLLAPTLNDLYLGHLAKVDRAESKHLLEALSPREIDIVRHLAKGIDNKTIAQAMGISEKTVRNQLAAIYARLGVHKRSQLILRLR